MPPTAILFLSSHGHAASLAASSSPGPLAVMAQVSGYLFVLLAAALIVTAVETVRQR